MSLVPSRDNPAYAELAAMSNFSFLRGASHPEELAAAAKALGLAALALADRNSFAGIVRAHAAAKEQGLKFIPAARLVFSDETPDIIAYPRDRASYGRLSRPLTRGNRRAEKGQCRLFRADLLEWGEGLNLALLAPPRWNEAADRALAEAVHAFPGRVRLAAGMTYGGRDRARLDRLAAHARTHGVPLLAVGDVLYHAPERRPLQDVLTCIREHKTVSTAGRLLKANAERHLKGPAEMARLFHDYPGALAETLRLAEECRFSLDELRYEYPDEPSGESATPQEELERLAWLGAHERYSGGLPDKVRKSLEHELALIAELDYACYFLTVYDIVRFARSRGILCQGRGSAANSAVCFCLGVTEVDPDRIDLLFERFVSAERREPPDIDVDFEHERREEVIQYIYEKYGRERAGIAATVISYRTRSAVREVGKAMGLSEDTVSALAGSVWGFSRDRLAGTEVRRLGLDPSDPTLALTLKLTRELTGFPRHLSQHVGGFVITKGRLDEVVPIANAAMEERTFIEWDKDDLDALGMLKIDVLGLGMLTCIRKAFDFIETHYGERLTIATIPAEDPSVYRMLGRADSLGVFQVESRAQMSMLPRLKPKNFYDLVIEVAIVRPGPIQGDMVHPYLKRRSGAEPVTYPSKDLEAVLGKTLGVPLFQEQAMKIAIVAAGFTPAEADRLRRAMATFRRVGTINSFRDKMIEGMVARNYDRDFAERCFKQIEGFGDYGFPESHAASFALLVYASAWLKCHFPDVFAAALINSQPMGFYAPAQIVRDAREHGVTARPPDVNRSDWDATLEPEENGTRRLQPNHAEMAADIRSSCAIRLGLRQVKGLCEEDIRTLMEARGKGYDSVRDLWLRTRLKMHVLERLADADAFRSLGLDRREALWAVKGLSGAAGDHDLPLFAVSPGGLRQDEPDMALPPMPLGEHVVNDYRFLKLSLKAHPVGFLREELDNSGHVRCQELARLRSGTTLKLAGLVLVRQRPGTAKGVIFATLEDETGIANIIVWPKTFERHRPVILGARFLSVSGRLQSEEGVIHIVAERLVDLTPLLARLADGGEEIEPFARCDAVKRPQNLPDSRIKSARAAMPKGRNFH